MGKREYKQRTGEQKVAILRQVLVEKQAVSKVCEEHGLSPTLFYEWQRQFFENGAAAFAKDKGGEVRGLEKKVEHLEAIGTDEPFRDARDAIVRKPQRPEGSDDRAQPIRHRPKQVSRQVDLGRRHVEFRDLVRRDLCTIGGRNAGLRDTRFDANGSQSDAVDNFAGEFVPRISSSTIGSTRSSITHNRPPAKSQRRTAANAE